jgi:hypothetical protein
VSQWRFLACAGLPNEVIAADASGILLDEDSIAGIGASGKSLTATCTGVSAWDWPYRKADPTKTNIARKPMKNRFAISPPRFYELIKVRIYYNTIYGFLSNCAGNEGEKNSPYRLGKISFSFA